KSIGGHQPEIPVPGNPLEGPEGSRRKKAGLRLMRRIWGVEREVSGVVAKREQRLSRIRSVDLTQLTTRGLLDAKNQFHMVHDGMDITVGIANSAEGPWELMLEQALKPLFGDQARATMGKLLAGTGSVTSAEHGYAVYQLAAAARTDPAAIEWLASPAPGTDWVKLPAGSAFRAALERFLQEFGHRAVYEADYLNPRWAEDPTYILDQVR